MEIIPPPPRIDACFSCLSRLSHSDTCRGFFQGSNRPTRPSRSPSHTLSSPRSSLAPLLEDAKRNVDSLRPAMWCCCWWPWRSFFIVITLVSTTGSLVSSQPTLAEKHMAVYERELPDLIVSLEKAEERVHSFANQQDEVAKRHLQYLHSELVQLKESFKGLKDEISGIPNGIKFNLLEHKRDEFKTKIDKVDELGVVVPFYIRRDNKEIEDLLNGLGKFFTSLDTLVKERKRPLFNQIASVVKSLIFF